MKLAHITDVDLSAQVRETLNAFVGPPHVLIGRSSTAETLNFSDVVETLMECTDEAGLTQISARAALTQFFAGAPRGNADVEALF